ncbi:SDR family NAD(P)-dependent oxidoreductase, partial [Pseudomonas sp. BAgro211]|nr:SDR family NAD(P)-dependent oxidoreductase [Pseudomonas sp. BAgro211]
MTTTQTTQSLTGKVAFVQGGSRGIGAAIVQRLAREGAAVAFTYVSSAQKAEDLAASIEAAGGRALALKADSGDAASVQQ